LLFFEFLAAVLGVLRVKASALEAWLFTAKFGTQFARSDDTPAAAPVQRKIEK